MVSIYKHTYTSVSTGRASLQGSTTYTSHEDVSHAKTSQMTLKNELTARCTAFAECLMRLHMTKPAGTSRLTSYSSLSQHCPWLYNQNQKPTRKMCLFDLCWKHSHHIWVNSQCLCRHSMLLYKNTPYFTGLNRTVLSSVMHILWKMFCSQMD